MYPGKKVCFLERVSIVGDWVIVVDDDKANLQLAGTILSRNNIRVTALQSGQALLDYVREKGEPDLILLDINMPGMDGFETLVKYRAQEKEHLLKNSVTRDLTKEEVPVIFLTAAEDEHAETKGLSLGAVDFIKKPFVPEVLLIRVRHMIDLMRLQRDLAKEVAKKTDEIEKLYIHLIQSLADAIDAKDTYTNGHSRRVAEYAREISGRHGYNELQQNEIYIIGLLHDIGKIGVPDAVINNPEKLTEDEFEMIKNHPVLGARILQNIRENPRLMIGAKYHHEKYGGGGYPEGLRGEEIPEEARIIAVADAYDAMTSRRSYRDSLPQETVRSEIEKGKGNQFDPVFAEIMLAMIDEDTDYIMRD
ncbi:MAG: response regulator [Acetatifactor sp.]|nr:response regulator [Acetatifactor sp.]